MGNCQTVDASETVMLEHPENGGKAERIYWPVSANEIMGSNPGYYVALVVESSNNVKLLRPEDTLDFGHVYRLISFQDVIKDFTIKKSAKIGKLESGNKDFGGFSPSFDNVQMGRHESGSRGVGRNRGGGQWRPALQTIAEL